MREPTNRNGGKSKKDKCNVHLTHGWVNCYASDMKVRSRKGLESTPKMNVEYVPLDTLKHYENNPRKNDHAVGDMMKVIEAVGFRVPLLVKGDEIIDGHLRAKAAKQLGMEKVPVMRCDDMDDKSVRLLRLMVNKAAEFADWDFDLLAGEFEDLEDAGVDFGQYEFEWFPKKRAARKSAGPKELLEVEEYNECPSCGHTWG